MKQNNRKQFNNIFFSNLTDEDSGEFIPLISPEDEEIMQNEGVPEELPILPLKNTVLFPGVVIPITVGRAKSIKLVKKAYKGDRIIGVVAQENPSSEEPGPEDLYKVGTIAKIIKMLVLPDGNTTIIIQGNRRFQIQSFIQEDPYIIAKIKLIHEVVPDKTKKETKALIQSLKDAAFKILKLNPDIPQEAQIALDNIESPGFLTHFLSSNINVDVSEKQKLLETNDGSKRATALLQFMLKDIQLLELKQEIQSKVHSDLDQQQRDFYLRQQIKVLQDELGYESNEQEISELRLKGNKKKWNDVVAKHFNKELDKIERMNPAAAEYPIALNYAELLVDLPWNEFTKDNFDLNKAKKILDKDHFGLDKVKDRIIEYLAVLKLKNNMKGPILCLYGPPGVGKTSLGKSVAKALGVNMSGCH
jgi:ATP-dependent Lon protease